MPVNAIGPVGSSSYATGAPGDPVSVARALSLLKLRPSSTLEIADTLENIQKNLDALQGVAGKISGLTATGDSQTLTVTAAQYARDSAVLAVWGEGGGNSVNVTDVGAGRARALVEAKPAYVGTITVADSALNIQNNLDDLQTLVSGGSVTQIVQTGAAAPIRITAAQFAANGDALGAIKNHAYALAITNASVSDTLGLDGQTALSANARIRSIEVKDGTDAIETNLDALQRLGLRLKSISQTDADNPLTLTASQYTKDKIVIGKILTSVQLDVIRASAAQAAQLAANRKVVTLAIADTAANIARKWGLLQRVSDSLSSVQVTDSSNAVTLTGDQVSNGADLLAKFADDGEHTYQLAVTGVRAAQATTVAAIGHVASVRVADSADNVVANLDDLATVNGAGALQGITLTGKATTLSMDATRMQGDALAATQSVLDRIAGAHYGLSLNAVAVTALDDLTSNRHVVAMQVTGSSQEIRAHLDALHVLGKRVAKIEQTDAGAAIDVSQSEFETRASVLARIDGGYTVNVEGVSASKALAYAKNTHVASLGVSDSARNLAVQWGALRSIGATLGKVSQTDTDPLAISASIYLAGQNDGLLAKFDAATSLRVTGATVAQSTQIAEDTAVGQIDIVDDGSAVSAGLTDLADLLSAGKLHGIALKTGTTGLSMHASQLDGAQGVLDTIAGGRYTLWLDQVDVADVANLLDANAKIARLRVTGDAAGIAAHLDELDGAGSKLVSIEQTDAGDSALALTGADFERYQPMLAKISGGYQADLTDVAASKASTLAANLAVQSLQVSGSAISLGSFWNALGSIGSKLTGIAQSDSSLVQLSTAQWTGVTGLADLFTTTLGVSVSGAGVSDVSSLASDDVVQKIQLNDTAESISDAWSGLAAQSKIDRVTVSNLSTALTLSAADYSAASTFAGLIQGAYQAALSDVAPADAATLGADTHVVQMDVTGPGSEIASHFDDLQALTQLGSITLSDANGTLSLAATQVLNGATTLAKITNVYQIAATDVSLADLADVQAVDGVASVSIADTAANVSARFSDVQALGSELNGIQLTDETPVLSLTQQVWASGSATLAKIAGAYQVDLSAVDAASAGTLASDTSVRQQSVLDTGAAVSSYWDALVAAYNDGSGNLAAIALSDADPLSLTAAQQTAGAAMIAALLPSATIVTTG